MNNARANKIFVWSLLIFFGGMITFGITHYFTKQDDLRGEQVAHSECTVFDKYDKKVSRGRAADRNYFIDSSCGLFRASDKDFSDTLEVGQVYNWSATVGNWANKPTIISAEIVTDY
jgi:hypothetical protein